MKNEQQTPTAVIDPPTAHDERHAKYGGWLQTYSGKTFFFRDMKAEDISLEDISHALSNYCRFAGHCKEFYSVAQHSVLVSNILNRHRDPKLELAGLLHDATEAYMGDVTRPLKQLLPEYKALENNLHKIIAAKFEVDLDDPLVKEADNIALMTEARDLLSEKPASWGVNVEPLWNYIVTPQRPHDAKNAFMMRYYYLSNAIRNAKQ